MGFVVGKQRFEMAGPLAEEKIVVIPRSSGVRDIAELLEREGVIDQSWLFIAGVVAMKAREDLKFGEYQFAPRVSLHDVVNVIMQGKVVQHAFSVPEGLTSEQIIARLSDNDVLTGNIRDIPREGTLLPETYKFTRGMTREQMIQRMQQQQRRLVQEIWDRRMPDLPIRTVEQLVILASIVEKETGKPEERTRVAAVFVNRLEAEDETAIRSDHHLWPGGRQGHARPADHAQRDRAGDARTIPMSSTACRPARSPIPGARRWRPRPIRRARKSCSSWPTAPAGTPSPTITSSIRRMSRACGQIEQQANPTAPRASGAPPARGSPRARRARRCDTSAAANGIVVSLNLVTPHALVTAAGRR